MTNTYKNKRTFEVYASRFSGVAEEEAGALVSMLEKMIENGIKRPSVRNLTDVAVYL